MFTAKDAVEKDAAFQGSNKFNSKIQYVLLVMYDINTMWHCEPRQLIMSLVEADKMVSIGAGYSA